MLYALITSYTFIPNETYKVKQISKIYNIVSVVSIKIIVAHPFNNSALFVFNSVHINEMNSVVHSPNSIYIMNAIHYPFSVNNSL